MKMESFQLQVASPTRPPLCPGPRWGLPPDRSLGSVRSVMVCSSPLANPGSAAAIKHHLSPLILKTTAQAIKSGHFIEQ